MIGAGTLRRGATLTCASLVLTSCAGVQSALAPAGREATRIADLFWWMAAGAIVIELAVLALAYYCIRTSRGIPNRRRDRALIVGGGVLVPIVVLTALLVYGLMMLPPLVARASDSPVQIHVVGEQWWWRVQYLRPGREPVALANEVRLPVGQRVQFRLESDNVIHAFWIPSLAGKIDMIPGRVTWLALEPTRTGVFRGACAEYCGTSHALMAFYTEVMQAAAFEQWLDAQAAPAVPPAEALASRGQALFFANGCSACHAIRGTAAAGGIGPDLTHVGGRLSIGAGTLAAVPGAFERWIATTDRIKPGVHMPQYGMLPPDDRRALAAYLEQLR
jgi:cytochrome c oxidase subunit 2